jgi:hypothetical protein
MHGTLHAFHMKKNKKIKGGWDGELIDPTGRKEIGNGMDVTCLM